MKASHLTNLSSSDKTIEARPIEILDHAYSHQGSFIAETLNVDVRAGLSSAEVALRLKRDGPNELGHDEGPAWPRMLLAQFSSIVVWLLIVAAAIAALSKGVAEASAILVVLLLNAIIGFAIEWKAGQALTALRRQTITVAHLRRDSHEKVINASGIVIGDIIVLTAGDRVPADARLIESRNLQTDESVLTGESTPVEKSSDVVSLSAVLPERRSMVYLGTMVVSGRGVAIVTATGRFTEMGRIGQLLEKTESEKTPLERRLESLGKILVYLVLGIAAVILIAGLIRGDRGLLMLEISISLAVAAVPEALPAMTTLILALGVLRMARNRAIVRRLAAVEALGSTTVICTDKTGTLTENRMSVREFQLANGQHFQMPRSAGTRDPLLDRLLRVSVLCNEAAFEKHPSESKMIGDPTETALLISADLLGFDITSDRRLFKTVYEEPFDAASGRMVTVVKNDQNVGPHLALVKGSPAVILAACSSYASHSGAILALDASSRERFIKINENLASGALRVLAFADKELEINTDIRSKANYREGFTFLGFVGMADPPRLGVASAIKIASEAGIRVVMLTGDQIRTARAIARELNLSQSGESAEVNASDLVGANNRMLLDAAKRTQVFARVSPEDKLRIVQALQQNGEIVAVTGDGINDAPALKRANIGIAMGCRGTEVAKEAADVVLTDDEFSTIVKAIEGGRVIYANIIKFVNFMFAANLAEVLVIFFSLIAGFALPLLPLQILWVNLVTDIFPALALALEPASPGIMKRRPRHPNEALLSSRFLFLISWQGFMLAIISLAAYMWALSEYGEGSHARTVAVLALIGVQIGHLFNCRSRTRSAFKGFFRNPYILAAVGLVTVVQALAIYTEPLARVLDLSRPNQSDLLVILGCLLTPIVIVEITKVLATRTIRIRQRS